MRFMPVPRYMGPSGIAITEPTTTPRLDGLDPYASKSVAERLRPGADILAELRLEPLDQIGRIWTNSSGRGVMWSEAWGRIADYGDEKSDSGSRLLIDIRLLKSLLRLRKGVIRQ